MTMRWPASTDVSIQKRSREKGGLQDFDDIFPGVFKILFLGPGLRIGLTKPNWTYMSLGVSQLPDEGGRTFPHYFR